MYASVDRKGLTDAIKHLQRHRPPQNSDVQIKDIPS